jgi:hypothetical protein
MLPVFHIVAVIYVIRTKENTESRRRRGEKE